MTEIEKLQNDMADIKQQIELIKNNASARTHAALIEFTYLRGEIMSLRAETRVDRILRNNREGE